MATIVSPVSLVRKARNRNAHRHIEESKRKPREKSKLRVGEIQLLFNGFLKDDQKLPVNEVENINQRKHPQYIIPVQVADFFCVSGHFAVHCGVIRR
jgi:hypothetical protein